VLYVTHVQVKAKRPNSVDAGCNLKRGAMFAGVRRPLLAALPLAAPDRVMAVTD
jgi:hypothetical protein